MGFDFGMKEVSSFVGLALVDPKWLEESYSQTASAATHAHIKDAGPNINLPKGISDLKGTVLYNIMCDFGCQDSLSIGSYTLSLSLYIYIFAGAKMF